MHADLVIEGSFQRIILEGKDEKIADPHSQIQARSYDTSLRVSESP